MSNDKKYKLTSETKQHGHTTLYRIEATKDFSYVKKGDKGGWIEKEFNLSQKGDAWVYGDAEVFGDAWVSGNAEVFGDAEVFGGARVSSGARVYGNARVSGDARVYGNAKVSGDAWVCSDARVYGNAKVSGKKAYAKGLFIGGDDTGKITNVTDQMGAVFWKAQYVLGDYEINDIEPENTKKRELLDKADELIKQATELKSKAEEM